MSDYCADWSHLVIFRSTTFSKRLRKLDKQIYRKNFVQGLRDQNINPYPHKFTRTHRIDEFRRDYDEQITEKVFIEDQTVSLTGRIMAIRGAGANLIFIDLEGEAELNRLAVALAEGGMVQMPAGNYGFSTLFTWVQDRFGVNWQLNVA